MSCNSAQCMRALGLDVDAAPAPRRLLTDGTVEMPFDRDALPLLRSFPGARWNPDRKVWTVSIEPADRDRVLEIADRLDLDVAPELRDDVTPAAVKAAVERAQANGAYPFQLDGVRFLALHDRALLADDMGLGKTMQVLHALPDDARAIVICPLSLRRNWANECKRWRPDLTPVVGEAREPASGEVVIVHFEAIRKVEAAAWGDIADATLVVDEAHRAKNYRTQQAKAVTALGRACARCWLLTGTPLLNRPFDLYGVLAAGDMTRRVFGGFRGFLRDFNGCKGRYGYEFGSPDACVPEKMRRVMLRRLKGDVVDLPAKVRSEIEINDLGARLRKQLDRALDAWADRDDLPSFEEFSKVRAALAKAKTAAALDYVTDAEEQDNPLLVFSAHRGPVEEIGSREGWAAITGTTPAEERARIVDAFQAGDLRGVAMTIAAGGVGLTLTRASTVLFVDLDWTPGNNLQAEDRAHRIGQTGASVQIVRIVAAHPLDRHVLDLLDQKTALIERAIEASVEYDAPEAEQGPAIDYETEADWRARLEAAQAAKDAAEADRLRDVARSKIDARVGGHGGRLPEIDTDSDQADALRRAVQLLARRCDGAMTEDGIGFNKPDAAVGHWLAASGMGRPADLKLAWLITRKYRGQIGGEVPEAY